MDAATPALRQRFVLDQVEAAATEPLQLPTLPNRRLCLRGLRLDPASLRTPAGTAPAWLAPDGSVQLQGADLRGADLQGANLSGADLSRANFTAVALRSATLRGARLESAYLIDIDASGADFSDIQASEADFTRALMEDTRFTGAVLRFASFTDALLDGANLDRADLWSARMNGVTATDALLRGTTLHEAQLQGADLSGAKFEGAELQNVNLRGAKLVGADLRGATIARADLEGADLSGASLARVDLSSCNLREVRLAGAWLENTRFRMDQLGPGIGEELAGEYGPARQGYLALEQNFRSLGNPEAASRSYRKSRRMGRLGAAAALRLAAKERRLRELPVRFIHWFGDAFAEWLCDYGESLPRVVRAYLVTLAAFAAYYGLTDSLRYTAEGGDGLAGTPVHDVLMLIGFSFLDMCSSGVPDIGLKPSSHHVYFITSMQYVTGVVLLGLFGYVLGNRLRR